MTSPDFLRLAEAVRHLAEHRERVRRLDEIATRLAGVDVVVVAGEQAVLDRLRVALDDGQELIFGMRPDGDGAEALDRLAELLSHSCWSVLDTVERQLDGKAGIVGSARGEVEQRLATWSEIAGRVESASREIRDRRLRVMEPRSLEYSRNRMTALVRMANASFKENRLLDVWRALGELERAAAADDTSRRSVPPQEVPERLGMLIKQASPFPLQLTILRGPLDADDIDYTLILHTSTEHRYLGGRAHERSTIPRINRERLLDERHRLARSSYRALREVTAGTAAPARTPDETPLVRLRETGRILYRLVIPERMQRVIEENAEAPLVVITDEPDFGWELLCADDFVALQRPVVRMPIARSTPRRATPAETVVRRRRVALVASAGGADYLPHSIREVRLIEAGLREAWGEGVDIHVFATGTARPADGANFDRVLIAADYDIIHYAGHAVFDTERPGRSGLVLDGPEHCSADKIQRLVSGAPLVFLNACETARLREPEDGPDPEWRSRGDQSEGLASAFLYGGGLACIGNSWPVPDRIAADFAVGFYTAALNGLPLGESMRVARRTVADRYPGDPSWVSFVLYGDPGQNLGAFENAYYT